MGRPRATAIEKLGKQAEQYVRLRLDAPASEGVTLEMIQRELKEKFAADVPYNTISNFKQRRWWPEKLRLGELKELFQAVKDDLGTNAISESTQALILEKLSEAMTRGAALDPHFLLKEQRLWAVHTANLDKIENEKKSLELQNQKLSEARERERKEVEKAVGDAAKDPKRALEQIREIYNLPVKGSGAASALPGEMGDG